MNARQYIITVMGVAAALLGGTVLLNATTDPYGLAVDSQRVALAGSDDEVRAGTFWRKTFAVRKTMPRTVILGTSRAEAGLDARYDGFAAEYRPVMNLALGALSIGQTRELLIHADAVTTVRMAIIGLDMESFLDEGRPDFDSAALRGNPESEPERLVRLRMDVSRTTLAASIARWIESKDSTRLDTRHQGTRSPQRMISDAELEEFDGQRGVIWAAEFSNFNSRHRYLFPPSQTSTQWKSDRPRAAAMSQFRELLKYARAHGIELRMFISPVHARYLEWYRRVGWWPLFEAWKRSLVESVEEEAKAAGSVPFALWDFSGFHVLAKETVPRLGDQSTLMRWYRDTSHYSPELGDLILARLLGESGIGNPDLAASPMQWTSIERHLANIRQGSDQYRLDQPEEVANVAEMLAYLQRLARK